MPIMIGLALASIGLLVIMALIGVVEQVPFSAISRDVFQVTGASVYIGLASNVGAFLWIISGSISVFTALALITADGPIRPALFLGLCGLFSLWLAFDDFFMVHEMTRHFGVPELVVYGCYLAAALYLIVGFRDVILADTAGGRHWPLLGIALILTGTSVIVDVTHDHVGLLGSDELRIFIEDSAKFLGISWWSTYFVLFSFTLLVARLRHN